MNYLERLKNKKKLKNTPDPCRQNRQNPEKGSFVSFVSTPTGAFFEKSRVDDSVTLAGDQGTKKSDPAPSGFCPTQPAAVVITCGLCRHFERDTINPAQGRGDCTAGENPAYPWPHVKRQCKAYGSIEGSLVHEEITAA